MLEGQVPGIVTRHLERGRVAYWDPGKGAVIIEDGAAGTVFTPREGLEYFNGLK